eukprot:g35606.t1
MPLFHLPYLVKRHWLFSPAGDPLTPCVTRRTQAELVTSDDSSRLITVRVLKHSPTYHVVARYPMTVGEAGYAVTDPSGQPRLWARCFPNPGPNTWGLVLRNH